MTSQHHIDYHRISEGITSFTGKPATKAQIEGVLAAGPGALLDLDKLNAMVEKDPNGIDAHQPGAKLDAGKVDLTHLADVSLALRAVCEVFMFGEGKYTRGGWQSVDNGYERYTKAMLRHYFTNEVVDSDSGLLHDAHLAWNALTRLELLLREGKK